MTLFEALTGGAFDRLNWQHSGEFDQNFSKKSNAWGFARGGHGRCWNLPVHNTSVVCSLTPAKTFVTCPVPSIPLTKLLNTIE